MKEEKIMSFAEIRRALAVASTAIAGLALTGTGVAHAETTYYEIVADHSGRCLDVQDASRAHGANVLQAYCVNGKNQQWRLVPTDGGYFKLVARHSGKCLDVQDASRFHGANVLQATCWSPGYNQQWKMRTMPGPKWRGTGTPFELIARHSGKCLDVQDASRAHGANVLQANCRGSSNQIWRLRTP
ncbi:arabinogalactan endo-1,4-beta-galactosidase [Microbispora catharanthi]|uniref:Arabinogalactan endo-1,4-beta-galactosidase n=2 Tax=Microbispora catharanthi TaxID=1712871 RepID=A0A5N6BNN8_9ACTN|nr:arabinogalactan endo-1,4-beta-galactosidase [Microbispora catharanthi]